MGYFILGILVGWLAEWLFFTFWVKGGENTDSADCADLRSALNAKNKEIASLKASSASTATSSATKSNVQSALSSTKTSKKASAKTSAKKAAATTSGASKAKTAKKPAAKKPTNVKATPKKSSASTASKKTSAKKTSAKKTPAKKTTAKSAPKATATKKAPAKKATTTKVATATTSSKGGARNAVTAKGIADNDLTMLSGIGPSMAATLGELGIDTYKKLAAMDDDILRDMLEASGARLNNNKEAMDTWNEQATFADEGNLEGLKKLQDSLKG